MTQLPPEAYPVVVFSSDRRATPTEFRVEITPDSAVLWLGGATVGVPRDADDTRLRATVMTAYAIVVAAERFSAFLREELDRREHLRRAEPALAALRAADHADRADLLAPEVPVELGPEQAAAGA